MFNQKAPTSTSGGMFTILEAGYDVDYGGLLATVEIEGVKHTIGMQGDLEKNKKMVVDKDCCYCFDDYVNKEIPCEWEFFMNMIKAAAKIAKVKLIREFNILGGVGYKRLT